jgi:A/G-specific adenine glycosylase
VVGERTRALLAWYEEHGRDLPWRGSTDPWKILVSEVMSQQTQITRVVPAWTVFMERYPTPGHLAATDRAELIRLWAGLGYQRRAINLQRAARIVDD